MSRYYVNKFLYQVDGDPELQRRFEQVVAEMMAH